MTMPFGSAPPDYVTQTKDPWEKFNRSIYRFNDKLDKAVVRPVANTYVRAVPAPARSSSPPGSADTAAISAPRRPTER